MTPMPTLRQLQFFLALVRRQSFSKAAEDCLVSQSTLSSAIKELEGLLEQALVDRSTRKFALTPVGEEVAERAAALISAAEDLTRAARDKRPLEGEFQLGVIPTIAPFLLPRATKRLQKAFPKLQLYIREDLTASLVDRLGAGLLDAILIALPYDMPGVDSIEIGDDPFWFVCSTDHPLAHRKTLKKSNLQDCNLLLLEDGHCLREHAIDACDLVDRQASGSFGGTSLFTITQMARSGLGATLAPEMAINNKLAKDAGLVAIPFADPKPSRKIGIAWRRGSGRGDEAAAIAEILKPLF